MVQNRGVFVPVAGDAGKWLAVSDGSGSELSTSALYWDRIVAPILTENPKNILYRPHYIASVRELVSLGVAEAPVILEEDSLTKDEQTKLIDVHFNITESLMRRDGENWSILDSSDIRSENMLGGKSNPGENFNMLHIHLMNALPVPNPNTPLESIVTFRNKRRDELERVQVELGRLASMYVGSAPSAQAIPRALQDLNLALSDARRVFNEKWTTRFFHSLKASFVSEALLPAATLHYFKLPLDKAFIVGAGLAVARASYSSLIGNPKSNSPYSVLFDAENIR